MISPNLTNPVKVRNQLRRLQKQEPYHCFTWDFDTKQLLGFQKTDYAAFLCEVQFTGLVKRCECWVQKRFSYIKDGKEYKKVIRMESYGQSKRERMTQSINPLAHAFNKIMIDYVYLFIESEEVSQEKLLFEINKSIKNGRLYDAEKKLKMLSCVFSETPQLQIEEFIQQIQNKKNEVDNLHKSFLQSSISSEILQENVDGEIIQNSPDEESQEVLIESEKLSETGEKTNAQEQIETLPLYSPPKLSHDYAKARTCGSPKSVLVASHLPFSPKKSLESEISHTIERISPHKSSTFSIQEDVFHGEEIKNSQMKQEDQSCCVGDKVQNFEIEKQQ